MAHHLTEWGRNGVNGLLHRTDIQAGKRVVTQYFRERIDNGHPTPIPTVTSTGDNTQKTIKQ